MEFELFQGKGPLSRRIYGHIREGIQSGNFAPGAKLPSTRALAASLGVSRSTVCEAYDMLAAEGFTDSRPGAPTRVREGIALEPAVITPKRKAVKSPPVRADFTTGRPDLREFPMSVWLKSLDGAMRSLDYRESGYRGPQGLKVLREELASWMYRSRGITASPHDIFITGGASQALYITARMLSRPGAKAIVEDPGVAGVQDMLAFAGYDLIPAPVDGRGIITEGFDPSARVIYVTPSHQFPLGGILPADRRASLVRFARAHDICIIEDDYDSEFRHFGAPVSPLCSIDPQRVIYVGTFSKLLFPALRVGYVILPPEYHDMWRRIRTYIDVQSPVCEQAALADLLKTRRLDRHIYSMRKLYGKRREALLTALREAFGNSFFALGDAAGLHTAVRFPGMCFDDEFLRLAARERHTHSVCRSARGHKRPSRGYAAARIRPS